MPKIIENLRERLIARAKSLLADSGYAALTIRSVAAGCGVGVGTVYNYFSSKDELVAAVMLEDWNRRMEALAAAAADSDGPEPVARCIYELLLDYARRYSSVFQAGQAAVMPGSFRRYHAMLRDQLAAPLARFSPDPFTSRFAAEALLAWTMEGMPFREIYGLLKKLF